VTQSVPLARAGQPDQCGESDAREIITSSSDQRTTGGMSVNEDGVADVRATCSAGDMQGGGEVRGESMMSTVKTRRRE